jgi:hypothetical protein
MDRATGGSSGREWAAQRYQQALGTSDTAYKPYFHAFSYNKGPNNQPYT